MMIKEIYLNKKDMAYKNYAISSILFFKLKGESTNAGNCKTWELVGSNSRISFDDDNFGNKRIGRSACILDKIEELEEYEYSNYDYDIRFSIHEFDTRNPNDWLILFNNLILRYNNQDDLFYFMEVLWILDKMLWSPDVVVNSLSRYPTQSRSFVLQKLAVAGKCLSANKQLLFKQVCDSFGIAYSVYTSKQLNDAYSSLFLDNEKLNSLNIFEIADAIFKFRMNAAFYRELSSIALNNLYIQTLIWIQADNISLENYSNLTAVCPLVSEQLRMDMIKRYFHDVRNERTQLNLSLLENFKTNAYDEFIRYRHSLEIPAEPVVLTVPLLCDSLITLYNTKGEEIQTFNGILDLAFTRVDRFHPDIDFQIDRIIPTCNNGAVINKDFIGFIDYNVIREIEADKLTDQNIKDEIIRFLNSVGEREKYPVCSNNNNERLSEEQVKYCKLSKKAKNGTLKLECLEYKNYDRWTINLDADIKQALNLFLTSELDEHLSGYFEISIDNINIYKLRENIAIINDRFNKDNKSVKGLTLEVLKRFTRPVRTSIYPQKDVILGRQFNLLNLYDINNATGKIDYSKEIKEVRLRVIKSLEKELKMQPNEEGIFELDCNELLLEKMCRMYYYNRESLDELNRGSAAIRREYLVAPKKLSFKQFCSPKLSEEKHPVVDMPYYWCRGKECFRNNLRFQMLESCNDWRRYSLYHLSEIIGYPKIKKSDRGYVLDSTIRQFIAIINKAMQKFRRLKCRECGHIMFSTGKQNQSNSYNNFACVNPICKELGKRVYLNHCFSCKNALIDSRDTKQCPNGFYICPSCLSCCDNYMLDNLTQPYYSTKKIVPGWIQSKLGKGHNDKGEFYCPHCGVQVEQNEDICSNCGKKLKKAIDSVDKDKGKLIL